MGAEIDRLEVQVEAQATKANSELDKLVRKLNRVATSLTGVNSRGLATMGAGVNKLSNAMSNFSKNTRTEDFSRLARNLMAVGKVDTSDFSKVAGGVTSMAVSFDKLGTVSANSVQIADMAKNIAKFGGANVQKAITNLPKLSAALSDFMTSMSKVPSVSINVIQMTKALSGLASQGSKVGAAANTVSNAMNTQAKSAERATKSNKGLTSALGSLYQKYFWLSRGIQKTWSSVESSMDFLETVNYFEVALRQIGDSAASAWKENGYASAEAYAESFAERAKQLTARMTGYEIDENGNASYTGMKNLGMDPDAVLNYQAVFAQVSSSIGVAEESALYFSKALTMLGADWASLRNLTFEQSWGKFASALAGQSRAVRSLGIDITNATLQEYAYKYGLEQAIQEMNQATKAQLRLLAILDQSEVAFGDLANTIGSPANQVRMLQQNMSNLARVIGNLFLPVVQNVLPYINGLAIAFQNLFSWVGGLLGIKFDAINSSMGGMSDEMVGLVGGAEDYEDALNGANSAAKKLKNNLQGWHEINNITTQDNSASGSNAVGGGSAVLDSTITSALADYEKAWNEAFDNMENKAQEWADKIGGYLEPLKKIINDFAIGDFFKAGKDTSALVSGIFNFVAEAIDRVDWYGIGQKIGDFLAGIDWIKVLSSFGNMLWQGIKGAIELYAGMFSEAPIETALLSMLVMPKALKAITASKYVIGLKKLATAFAKTAAALTGNKEATKYLVDEYPKLGKAVNVSRRAFENFRFGLENGNLFTGINEGVSTVRDNLTAFQKGLIGIVSVAGEFVLVKDAFYDLASGSDNVVESLLKIVVGAGAASAALYVAFGPAGLVVAAITGVAAAIMGINKAIEEAQLETLFDSVKESGTVAIETLQTSFEGAVTDIVGYAEKTREKLSSIEESKESIEQTADSIGLIVEAVENGAYELKDKVPLVIEQFNNLLTETKGVFEEEYDVIVGNVMGAYADILEAQGKSVPEMVQGLAALRDETIAAYSDLEEQAKSLEEQYNSGAISADEFWSQYTPIIQKIHDFNGNKELDNATSALESFYGALDISKYIDGTEFNLSSFSADMEQFSELAEVGKNSIALFGEESAKNLEDMIKKVESVGGNADKYSEDILTIYGANDEYVVKNTQAIENAYQGYMDIIQQNLLEQLPAVVENATKDYNKLHWWEKLFKTKSDYVKGVVDDWKGNIVSPATSAIEKGLKELGIEGSAWAKEQANTITDSLFTSYVSGVSVGFVEYESGLRSDWKSFIEKSLSELPSTSETYGENTVTGLNSGIANNVKSTEEAVEEWMSDTETAIHDSAMDFGSPSKTAMKFGLDVVLGFNSGISDNTQKTLNVINAYMDKVRDAMCGQIPTFYSVGTDIMSGLYDGMSSKETDIYDKAQEIANGIAKTVQTALNIHSPSRVMFGLGKYTTEGFIEGIQSMFPKVEPALGDFTRITESLYSSERSNYKSQVMSFTEQYSEISNKDNYMAEEINNLLRRQNELLRALLDKPVLDSGDVFKASKAGYRFEAARLNAEGDPARVWG